MSGNPSFEGLNRQINRTDLVLLFINSIIGAGIFGLPAKIYALAGIYSIPALFLCGGIVFILVLNFAEVASRFDRTGGPYLYTLTAFGSSAGFVVGWILLITRVATYAALINLLAIYMGYFFPALQEPAGRGLLITAITLIFGWINYLGIRNSTLLNDSLALVKLIPLLIFIAVGIFFIEPQRIDFSQPLPTLDNFSSAVLVMIFAFTGFEAILVNTGEIKKPGKTIPFALIISISMVTIFYGAIQLVSIGMLSDPGASEAPITEAASVFLGPAGALLITAGAIISIGGTLNSVLLVGSRIPYALAASGQFPQVFGKLHPSKRVPVFSLILFCVLTLFASLSGTFTYAVSISVISKVMIFLAVCLANIKLRRKEKSSTVASAAFRLRYGLALAIIGSMLSLFLLLNAKPEDLISVVLVVLAGFLFYTLYKNIHKRS